MAKKCVSKTDIKFVLQLLESMQLCIRDYKRWHDESFYSSSDLLDDLRVNVNDLVNLLDMEF